MREFLLSPAARLDLFDIWEYIAESDIEAVDRVRDEIYEAILRVIMMPTIGHLREDLADDETLRFWPIRHYLIIYRPDSQPSQLCGVLAVTAI